MAKELPYYKFEPSEWLEGEIQICSDAAIVCFTNLCSGYWLKLGSMSYAFALHKYMRKDASLLQELIKCKIIALQEDEITINFLDRQLKEFKVVSNKRSEAAKIRWAKDTDNKKVNANALQVVSTSNAIREEKRREEERREDIIKNKKPVFNFRKELINLGGDEQFINDWLKARKKKKASDTKTAFNGFKKQLVISGLDINTVLELCAVHSWITFKAEYAEGKVLNTNLDTDISESKLLTRWKDARKHYDKQETSIKQLTEDERKNFNKLLSDYKLKDFEQAIAGLFQQETFKTTRLRPTHFLQREHFEKYLTCFHTKEKLFNKKRNNSIQRI